MMYNLRAFRFYNKCIRINNALKSQKRCILSSNYSCDNQWQKRLNNDLLMKINAESFFNELSQRYLKKLRVSAVDIDMFVNVVTNSEHLDEMENLLYKFRRTKETVNTLESTHHAVCRLFINFKQTNRLVNLLWDRIGYGIFPDSFTNNMILDDLLETQNYLNAAKVAALMMLQEDYGNDISKVLALYSVHMYLKDDNRLKFFDHENVKESENIENKDEDEDDDDIQYIRVPYLKNNYFDDHFDLRDTDLICGKTLYYIGKQFDDLCGRSFQIIGLSLYQKWKKALDLLNHFSSKEQFVVVSQTIEFVSKIFEGLPEDNPNRNDLLDLLNKLNELNSEGKVGKLSLDDLLIEKLSLIKNFEKSDIENMPKLFIEWENTRENALSDQIEEMIKEQRRKEIAEKKEQLIQKERLLFFFENFSKHEIDFVEAEKKIEELKAKTKVDEDYVPPEI